MTRKHTKTGGGLRPLPRLFLAGLASLPLAACDTDRLVQVEDPSQLRPDQFDNPASVPQLLNGSLRQLIGGYSGFGGDSFLSASGLISDELYWGDTFTTRVAVDQRALQPAVLGNISDGSFSALQQARTNALRTIATIERFSTDATVAATADRDKALLRTIEGYTYVTLSEGWCSAVPFTQVPLSGAVDPTKLVGGKPLTTAEMNDTAVERFTRALTVPAAANPNRNLARIGQARAHLNNGRFAQAAAAVSGIATSYVFHLEHSETNGSQNNPIFQLQSNGRYGLSNLEGGSTATGTAVRPDIRIPATTAANAEGIAYRGLRDPRVPWIGRASNNNACFSGSATCWNNNNYPTNDSDVPLASGVEARLIEAEAALQAGDAAQMVTILNALRADVAALTRVLYPDSRQTFPIAPTPPTLTALTDPATAEMTADQQFAARRNLLFQERALWLFNTGHRQGDLRRLARQYGLSTAQAFPSGPYFRGGTFGNDVAFPVPFNEENNPNFQRAQCVTTQP